MNNNYCSFVNTYWYQQNDIAIETPPTVVYIMHESKTLFLTFNNNILYYCF